MNCTILGAGSGLPHPDHNQAAIMVRTGHGSYLADCGEGTARQLLEHGWNKDFLDAILISHYHPDHVSGIFMVLQMLYLEGRTKPLELYLPERPADFLEAMHLFYTFEQRFPFQLKVHELTEAGLLHNDITCLANDHLTGYSEFVQKHQYSNRLQSFSLVFEDQGKTLLYTSDCRTFQGLENAMQDADLIIMDGLHPEAKDIISFLNEHRKRMLLIHGISETLSEWLGKTTCNAVESAVEDKTYEI